MGVITATIQTTSFLGDDQTIEIAPATTVWNFDAAPALSCSFQDALLINYGAILNSDGFGVRFSSTASGTVINQVGGSIAGDQAVFTDSDGFLLFNFGTITGREAGDGAVQTGTSASAVVIDNRAGIFGLGIGVKDFTSIGGTRIVNSGAIEAAEYGVSAFTGAGLLTTIVNSGTIVGGDASIAVVNGTAGRIDLTNTGRLVGDVSLHSAVADGDKIVNAGTILGKILLGNGADFFKGTGGTSGAIFGEAGVDRLIGGKGGEKISGGVGKDHFLFDAALAANVDRITDLNVLQDTIDLKHSVFPATNASGKLLASMFFAGAAAHDGSDRIVYNPANGWVSYAADGNGGGAAVHFATLAKNLAMTNADFLIV